MTKDTKTYYTQSALEDFLSGKLSLEDAGRVRDWLADPRDEDYKTAMLERAFDRTVQPTDEPGDDAFRMLDDFMARVMEDEIQPVAAEPSDYALRMLEGFKERVGVENFGAEAPAASKSRRQLWRGAMKVAAVALVVVGLGAGTLYVLNDRPVELPQPVATVIESGEGNREVTLPCGTTVIMNKGAVISYIEETYAEKREIGLSGEAYLMVAKQDGAPFTVETPTLRVNVLGTIFNINSGNGGEAIVSLYEGAVAVEAGGSTRELEPQQEFAWNEQAGSSDVRAISSALPEWLTHFNTISLRSIFTMIESHYGMPVKAHSSVDTHQFYLFSFDDGSGLDGMLSLLCEISGDIAYEIKDNTVHIKSLR